MTGVPQTPPPTPQPAVIDATTGLCVANCAAINDAIDAWYRENGCDGWTAGNFLGVVGLSPCGKSRDEVERMLLQDAAKQQLEQNKKTALFLRPGRATE